MAKKFKKECAGCDFFRTANLRDAIGMAIHLADGFGECRKYAPQIVAGVGTGGSNQMHPQVLSTHYCGDYLRWDAMAELEDR